MDEEQRQGHNPPTTIEVLPETHAVSTPQDRKTGLPSAALCLFPNFPSRLLTSSRSPAVLMAPLPPQDGVLPHIPSGDASICVASIRQCL